MNFINFSLVSILLAGLTNSSSAHQCSQPGQIAFVTSQTPGEVYNGSGAIGILNSKKIKATIFVDENQFGTSIQQSDIYHVNQYYNHHFGKLLVFNNTSPINENNVANQLTKIDKLSSKSYHMTNFVMSNSNDTTKPVDKYIKDPKYKFIVPSNLDIVKSPRTLDFLKESFIISIDKLPSAKFEEFINRASSDHFKFVTLEECNPPKSSITEKKRCPTKINPK